MNNPLVGGGGRSAETRVVTTSLSKMSSFQQKMLRHAKKQRCVA